MTGDGPSPGTGGPDARRTGGLSASTGTGPSTLLTEWARLLLGSLRRAGVRDVVISPGSRSTPFAWAALQEPGLTCRSVIDERSAAFFAVGHARMSGRPVLLICTSGSAAANYFPAVVEASEAAVPLLVLTADRPLELQQAAAPQTIDQIKLYGDYARAYLELGTPDPDPRMLRALPRLAAQAVATAQHPPLPGPVQINARARKPLEPQKSQEPAAVVLRQEVDRLLERVPLVTRPDVRASAELLEVAAACRRARRGLIVCGPATPAAGVETGTVALLQEATGFPIVAEWGSQCRSRGGRDTMVLDTFELLLEMPWFRQGFQPDLILQIGRPPTASGWHAAMDQWADVERYVLAPHGWPDPWSRCTGMIRADLGPTLFRLLDDINRSAEVPGEQSAPTASQASLRAWREGLEGLNRRARHLIDQSTYDGFSEGAAVRAVLDHLPSDSVLAVGNSLAIRELDLFVPSTDRVLPVVSQRGANGIDGLISGAAGAAAAGGRPVTLILGDVSFAHDIGGLSLVRELPVPLTVVVLNNRGGRIFERLPLASAVEAEQMRPWLTPPDLDIEAASRAYGLGYAQGTDVESVRAGLNALAGSGGVLEVIVPEGGTTEHQRELRQRVTDQLRP